MAACSTTDSKPHNHSWNDGEVTTQATCGKAGVKTYTCAGCGETKTEKIEKLEHAHSEDWLKNAEEHWHAATCEHSTERVGVSAHEWGDGVVVTAATCLKTGLKRFTCVCGETKTEKIEKTAHLYAETWSTDGDKHWHVCTTEGCNEITAEGAHNWNSGEVTTPATCLAKGEKTFTCTDCNLTRTEEVAVTDHSYGTDWSYDEDGNGHYHACTTDGCTEKIDQNAHTYGEWSKEGRISKPCTECGYEVMAPALTMCEEGSEWYEQLTKATTTVGGGEKGAMNIFTMGIYYYTVTYSGNEPIKVVCEYYDRLGELISHEYTLSPQNPSFTEKLLDRRIACLFIESEAETAFECELRLSYSETAPKHTHNFSDEWSSSETEHWHACTGENCEEAEDVETHDWDGNVCTICGYDKSTEQE